MYVKIYEFNKTRNNFSFDADTEIALFAEEKKEFYAAETLADMVDALVDCEYVAFGTAMKMDANNITEWPYDRSTAMMATILTDALSTHIKSTVDVNALFTLIVQSSMQIVCDINALKTKSLDENGKVIKGDIPNATESIADLLTLEINKANGATENEEK